ncbi:hypothetical protein GCM10017673_44550 [Streptosporangium violaceochromogenes]|nr:hypothetical protein GCM10017673_44550 [Streptosporangium violaceochromogenes]
MATRLTPDGTARAGRLRIRSEGVSGLVRDSAPGRGGEERSARDPLPGLPEEGARLLAEALGEGALEPIEVIELDRLASRRGAVLEVTVDAPGENEGRLLLETDGTGVLRWHLPRGGATSGTDRGTATRTFRVEVTRVPLGGDDRGVLAYGVKKVLHLLSFPVESVAREAGLRLVARWEAKARAYGLAPFTGGALTGPIDGREPTAQEWARLTGGPALLLLHGTFGRARSAFCDLTADRAFMAELERIYGGRVLALDHPTMHVDPMANARWLAERVPAGRRLVLDVLAHSRGGLVARCLPLAGQDRFAPRRLIHVATPNAGTVLAGEDRLETLLDAVTNLCVLAPAEVVSASLAAVMEVAKQLALGVRSGLDGLTAMAPEGAFLRRLNVPSDGYSSRHAVATDFHGASASLPVRALDALADLTFGVANDLVVPTEGVHSAGSYRVADRMIVPSSHTVSHTTFFRAPAVRKRVLAWLGAPGGGSPEK